MWPWPLETTHQHPMSGRAWQLVRLVRCSQASAPDSPARGLNFIDILCHISGLSSHWRDKSLHPNLFSSKEVDCIVEATVVTTMQPLPSQMSVARFNREISV